MTRVLYLCTVFVRVERIDLGAQPPACMDRHTLPETLRAGRPASAALALTQAAARLDVPVWQATQLARSTVPTAPTGWATLDAELPGGGWPMAGLTELLADAASGEMALLAPWLQSLAQRSTGTQTLIWIAPPAWPCVAALEALGLALPRLVFVAPTCAADAAWSAEQALRAGSCAAVLWWSHGLGERPAPVSGTTLRRLHLAAQAGGTPLVALRPPQARTLSSPAPLRLGCTPTEGRRLAVDVFKRRGPPMTAPLALALPWPASVRRAVRRPAERPSLAPALSSRPHDAVDRPAPAASAAASPALVATGS
jgi:protein ImuA